VHDIRKLASVGWFRLGTLAELAVLKELVAVDPELSRKREPDRRQLLEDLGDVVAGNVPGARGFYRKTGP